MENDEFRSKLSEYIKFVFDHEQEFVIEFLREFAGCEVDSFYMASKHCIVNLVDMEIGSHYSTTIETGRYLSWITKINHENNTST